MSSISDNDVEAVRFVLANLTGSGFSGDLGYAGAAKLSEQAELSVTETEQILEYLLRSGEIISDGQGHYAGQPVQCVLCHDDPCTCGLGSWR